MKPLPNESYEQWANRVDMFERGRAMQRLAQGESAETVMEDMARRIMEKMLHPVFKSLQESAITKFDPIKNRQDYESTMRYHKPVADHVDGNLFDKDR